MTSYIVEALLLIVFFLVIDKIRQLHKANQPRWTWRQADPRRGHSCCLDTPCSRQCGERRSALMIASTIDGVRSGEALRELVRLAEDATAQRSLGPDGRRGPQQYRDSGTGVA